MWRMYLSNMACEDPAMSKGGCVGGHVGRLQLSLSVKTLFFNDRA